MRLARLPSADPAILALPSLAHQTPKSSLLEAVCEPRSIPNVHRVWAENSGDPGLPTLKYTKAAPARRAATATRSPRARDAKDLTSRATVERTRRRSAPKRVCCAGTSSRHKGHGPDAGPERKTRRSAPCAAPQGPPAERHETRPAAARSTDDPRGSRGAAATRPRTNPCGSRGAAATTDDPRGSRGAAATRPRGRSTRQPRPRTIHAAAAAPPRPVRGRSTL